jgi:hypothetical protein
MRAAMSQLNLNLLKSLAQVCIEEESFETAIRRTRKLAAQDLWDEEAAHLSMTRILPKGLRSLLWELVMGKKKFCNLPTPLA